MVAVAGAGLGLGGFVWGGEIEPGADQGFSRGGEGWWIFKKKSKLCRPSLRGQTVHWLGAQFCVCMFQDSSKQPLNMLKFVGTIKGNEKTKEEQRESASIQKCTVLPRNAFIFFSQPKCVSELSLKDKMAIWANFGKI